MKEDVKRKILYGLDTVSRGPFMAKLRQEMESRAHQLRKRIQKPGIGAVQFGDLRRLVPISRSFGLNRGTPIDRYYIERFLSAHSLDIRGHVLEIGDDRYTLKFGGTRVVKSDILYVVEGDHRATVIADLTKAHNISSNTYDCIICTQTLQMIYEIRLAIEHLHRILKPGGVLLVTSHGTSKISRREGVDPWGEYWRFTTQSMQKLFQGRFPTSNIHIKAYGNVLSAVAFLHGLAKEDLSERELDYFDQDYEVLIGVKAVKTHSH